MKHKKDSNLFMVIAVPLALVCFVYMFGKSAKEGYSSFRCRKEGANPNGCACPYGYNFVSDADGKGTSGCVNNWDKVNKGFPGVPAVPAVPAIPASRCAYPLKWDGITSCIWPKP